MQNDTAEHQESLNPLNEEVVRILVENHRRFRSFLSARVGSDAIADDLLQQGLKKAVEHPSRSSEQTSILAWFYEILRTTLTDHYRKSASEKKKHEALAETLLAEGTFSASVADEIEAAVCQCMKGLLPTLKPDYAEVLQRVDLQSESPDAVASELSISRNNLDVRLHRARQAMKRALVRSCGTCTKHGCLDCTCGSK